MRRGQLHEPGVRRKLLGAWYTPEALVEHVVATTMAGIGDRPLSVLDPACGDGRFLAAAARATGGRARLVGVDVDPGAVAETRRNVPGAEVRRADALRCDWGDERFDIVLGNPPYLNQMAVASTRGGRSPHGGGPYANVAAEFLALAVQLARDDGGRVGLVLPQSLLSARDAGPIRECVERQAAVIALWWSDAHMFDAAVHTCAMTFEKGAPQREVRRSRGSGFEPTSPAEMGRAWASLLLERPGIDAGHEGPTLGDLATFTLAFRDEYYGMVGAVGDHRSGPKLVTSGLLDPGRCRWGERPVRFARQTYAAPRVDLARLDQRMQRWAARRLVPKILVANQTPVIEAAVDRDGDWLPGVPVITCFTDRLDEVFARLSAPPATEWVRAHAAGSGLSARALRFTPSLLASIPLTP